jgi:hypothetical protein
MIVQETTICGFDQPRSQGRNGIIRDVVLSPDADGKSAIAA